MGLQDRSYVGGYTSRFSMPPGVKFLLISQGAVFLFLFFGLSVLHIGIVEDIYRIFALIPLFATRGYFWQILTYSFLHIDPWHFVMNGLTIWFIGSSLEMAWGTKRFLQFYFYCVAGGALLGIATAFFFKYQHVPIIGSSGGGFGLLVAFGVLFAEQIVVFYIFPMKAKYLVLLLCGIQVLQAFIPGSGTAHSVHFGGIFTAIGYLVYYRRFPKLKFVEALRYRYKQWKIERARKKFQVYLRKNSSDRGPYVN